MRRSYRLACLAVLTMLAAGCDSLSATGVATAERNARAQHVLRALIAGHRDEVDAHIRFGTDSAAVADGMSQVDNILRGRSVDSLQLIGASKWSFNDGETLSLTYELRTDRGWLGATITTLDSAGAWKLTGVRVEPLPGELKAINSFDLRARGLAQYAGLVLVAICTAISLGAAIFIASRRRYPKRWRWVMASLVGAGAVYVNWTTGEISARLLILQLFAASVVRPSAYSPWMLSFSLPVGAFVALARYRKWRSPGTQAYAEVPSNEAIT